MRPTCLPIPATAAWGAQAESNRRVQASEARRRFRRRARLVPRPRIELGDAGLEGPGAAQRAGWSPQDESNARSEVRSLRPRSAGEGMVARTGFEPALDCLKGSGPTLDDRAVVGADGFAPPSSGCRPEVLLLNEAPVNGAHPRTRTGLPALRRRWCGPSRWAVGRSPRTRTGMCPDPKSGGLPITLATETGAPEGNQTLLHPLDRRRYSQSATGARLVGALGFEPRTGSLRGCCDSRFTILPGTSGWSRTNRYPVIGRVSYRWKTLAKWCAGVDSNHRNPEGQQIYSLPQLPLCHRR